ncbi:AI-2E family transporter [Scytonema hofmannii]|uniref:AI-2E family transporter n=1 Tax=Scytonema hofmannii TaxID=34078 RepID=UPI0003473721
MRLGQWFGFLAVAISLYILWQIRQVLLLVFAAIILATVLNRIVRFLQQRHIQRGIAVAISVILLLTLLSGFLAIVLPRLADQLQQLANISPQILAQLRTGYEWIQSKLPEQLILNNTSFGALVQNFQSSAARLLGSFFTLVK